MGWFRVKKKSSGMLSHLTSTSDNKVKNCSKDDLFRK